MITSFAQNNEIFIQFQVTLSQCSHLKSWKFSLGAQVPEHPH